MRFFSLILAAGLLLTWSCKSGGGVAGEMTSPKGFKYTLHKNAGGKKPTIGDVVSFHIQQRNGDSIMFSTREMDNMQIIEIKDNPNPSAVEDVLNVLGVGDSASVEIALDTMKNLPPDLEGVKSLFFDIVVIDIQSKADFEKKEADRKAEAEVAAQAYREREPEVAKMIAETLKKYKENSLGSDLKTTPEGLKYVIHQEGTGAQATAGKMVEVAYYGVLTDGNMFDNSFSRGDPFAFPLGQGRVIQGWDLGIALLKEGAKATFFIPANLAYGEAGSPPVIPANAELVFYVELNKVN